MNTKFSDFVNLTIREDTVPYIKHVSCIMHPFLNADGNRLRQALDTARWMIIKRKFNRSFREFFAKGKEFRQPEFLKTVVYNFEIQSHILQYPPPVKPSSSEQLIIWTYHFAEEGCTDAIKLDADVFIMPYGSYTVRSVEDVESHDVMVVNLDVFSSDDTHDSWPLAPKY